MQISQLKKNAKGNLIHTMFNICDEAQREQNSSQVKTQTLKEKKKNSTFYFQAVVVTH